MKRILIVVPTKDRSEMVNEVLKYEMPYYSKMPLDLCYFDSSADDSTELVIKNISSEINIPIMYFRINPELCLDYKIVKIFQQLEIMNYEYFWLINDSVSISEEMINYVCRLTENN